MTPPRVREVFPPGAIRAEGACLGVLVAGALGLPFFVARLVVPAILTAAVAVVRALPVIALAAFAILLSPILLCEVLLGLWLLLKGVRIAENA